MEVTNKKLSILDDIQMIIYGKRKEPLTPIEINRLFQLPASPEFNLIIYRALQKKVINPDVTLLQAIARAKNGEYLISIALCLRYGADVNMYVDAPRLGTIHLLGYVYNILVEDVDNSILNTIVIMLIIHGSRPSLPIFDNRAGKIRNNNEVTSPYLSVRDWLYDKGYKTILDTINIGDPNEIQNILDPDSSAMLSILLDNAILTSREYQPQDMSLAIRSFSNGVFDKIPTPSAKILMDFKSLEESVVYLNSDSYQALIKRGQLPSYILINKILINMRDYKNTGKIVLVQELEKILLSSISVGTQLDMDQFNIISVMGKDILESVTREYEKPYWSKICKSSNRDKIPDPLRKLAISLNVDPTLSQNAVCESITALSKSDKEALKEAARKRQQLRMNANLGHINEFIGDKTPTLVCRNKSLLPHDPLDYNDIDIAYYRDQQGAVWCFGSDSFESLLETGINPYNSVELPESFKDELKYRILVLKRLGINSTELGVYASKIPITFSESIDSLTDKDIVSEKSSQQELLNFTQLASKYNISPVTIKSLTKQSMIEAFQSIGYNVNLNPLSTSHSLITTARIVNYLYTINPNNINSFFDSLNQYN
jgi:hypothetical protein